MKQQLDSIISPLGITPVSVHEQHLEEVYCEVPLDGFDRVCVAMHREMKSPVMAFFACDDRDSRGGYTLYCAFAERKAARWIFITTLVPENEPFYPALSKEMFSAHLFERETGEMFGLAATGSPDARRLHLHDEVWPRGWHPLRKDFTLVESRLEKARGEITDSYAFGRVEGEGVFQIPVGPVHAGVIGPGHFRFNVAGEPVIQLEIRLGFTHRGVEKLFEGKAPIEALSLAEIVSGDSSCAHGLAFCAAVEKIGGILVPQRARYLRGMMLEMERLYNHANDCGGIALDVGFSFAAQFASVIKENALRANRLLSGNRYLKGMLVPGGVTRDVSPEDLGCFIKMLRGITDDFLELKKMLESSVSFLDRVDGTGVLQRKVAEDLGIIGLAGRASGLDRDLRRDFPASCPDALMNPVIREKGDVRARLDARLLEAEESVAIIRRCASLLTPGPVKEELTGQADGTALGYTEGWRGPVLYWIRVKNGAIDRCKIVDPSFHNWPGLAHAVPGNIVPDFPVCNKSFDLSYSGNDL